MKRRELLAAFTGASVLGGCGALGLAPNERIVDVASGRTLGRDALLAALRGSDYALLGEQHDNPRHHALRGALLADLGTSATVVAEQLPAGRRVVFGGDLLESLRTAGFDPEAWAWPVHEPLFQAIARAGLPLTGGDIDRDAARRAAREGEAGLTASTREVLLAAPLSPAAQAALDADLLGSHCGMLPAARVPAMRWGQRARDAALWSALRGSGGHPAVLVAGNGHVRLDYGVPRLIAAAEPAARVISVGFVDSADELDVARGRYTHVWLTAAPTRGDPCAGFGAPVVK